MRGVPNGPLAPSSRSIILFIFVRIFLIFVLYKLFIVRDSNNNIRILFIILCVGPAIIFMHSPVLASVTFMHSMTHQCSRDAFYEALLVHSAAVNLPESPLKRTVVAMAFDGLMDALDRCSAELYTMVMEVHAAMSERPARQTPPMEPETESDEDSTDTLDSPRPCSQPPSPAPQRCRRGEL